uniref:Uncharacterized protein n=1 Tax=viral metagenome TaxID=1070528 RepID=A0A6M3L1T8_9ZZZZ
MNTETIIYISRKLGWTLDEIGKLTPEQISELLTELYYQESVEEYRRQNSVANILAAIYNTIPRKRGSKALKASDFLSGKPPERFVEKTIEELARDKGIKFPKEKDESTSKG